MSKKKYTKRVSISGSISKGIADFSTNVTGWATKSRKKEKKDE